MVNVKIRINYATKIPKQTVALYLNTINVGVKYLNTISRIIFHFPWVSEGGDAVCRRG